MNPQNRPAQDHALLANESGLYRVAGLSGAEVAATARGWGWRAAHINARDVLSKAQFLAAAARALHFPAYFGSNWDAFEECLRDLPPAAGTLIAIEEPAAFARAHPREWATALAILAEVSTFWRAQGHPFYVLLSHTRGAAPNVPLLR